MTMPRFRRLWPLIPVIAFLGLFLVYPVAELFSLSFADSAGRPSLIHVERLFDRPVYWRVLKSTFAIAGWTTVICLVLGYPVAYLLAQLDERRRNWLLLVVLMPFWTGFLVRTFAWMILLSPSGPLTGLAAAIGIHDVKLIYNLTGVLIGTAHALLPLAILNMLSVMQDIDRNLARAAATLGAQPGQSFWRVYFPLSLPGVAAGGLIVFITALGFFITPTLLGGPNETMLAQVIITQIQELVNWGFAGILSLVLLVSALIVYYAYDRLLGISRLVGPGSTGPSARTAARFDAPLARVGRLVLNGLGTICAGVGLLTGHGPRARSSRWSPGKGALRAAVIAVLVFMVLPSLFVIPVSFTNSTFLDFPPRGLSLRWYEELLSSRIWLLAAARSLWIAVLTAGASMILGVAAAFVLARQRFVGHAAIVGLILSPLILPRVTIAVALFYLLARLGLVGTDLGLIIGHTIIAFPYVVITLLATLKAYDHRLDEAAWTLGANPWRTMTRVTLPMIRGGILAAAIFAFMTSFDDLNIALFLSGGEQNTLPRQMWSTMILQASPLIGAASTMLLVLMTAFAVLAETARRRAR